MSWLNKGTKAACSKSAGKWKAITGHDVIHYRIHHEMTVRDTPEQNGVAERMNRTLCESGRAMLFHAELSKGFWAEAINTAVYIRNRLITSATGETPYFRCFGEAADVSHLRVFGCMAFAHVPDDKRQKFDKKAWKLRFVGYADNQ